MKIPAMWLYVPSLKESMMKKAIASLADVVIFDLEDSVPESEKVNARNNIKNILNSKDNSYLSCVRTNQVSTVDGVTDLLFLRDNNICPDYILVPKADVEKDAWFVSSLLNIFDKPPKIYLLVETVDSLCQLRNLSKKPENVEGVFFGSADFSASLYVNPSQNEFIWARQEVALQARRLNLTAIDTPCFSPHDTEINIRHARQAREMGFSGLQVIHPKQLDSANSVFSFDSSKYSEIKETIDNANKRGDCAVKQVNNHVIGPPLLRYIRNMEKEMEQKC